VSAQIEVCRKRVIAVLASGVVISLTALTSGMAPAYAKPDTNPVAPTTVVVPQPQEAPPQAAPPKAEAPAPVQLPKVVEAPPAPAPAPAPAPVELPVSPPSVEAPPKPRAIEAPPAVEPAPKTQDASPPPSATATATAAPKPPTSSAEPPAPRKSLPPSPDVQAPATSTAPSVASSAPTSKPEPAPAPAEVTPPTTVATSASPAPPSAPPSAGPTPPSAGLVAPAPETGDPKPEVEATAAQPPSGAMNSSASSVSPASPASSTVSQAAKVIEIEAPKTLEAPQADVVLAKNSKPLELTPDPAPKQDVEALSSVINLPKHDRDGRDEDTNRVNAGAFRDDGDPFRNGRDGGGDRRVQQWNWVEYDDYYRPVISNPYRDPVRIIYVYQNSPRIVTIPPLARIVLQVAELAAYSFTAIVTNAVNQAVNVAVGSFFGGGYFPGIGLPLPPPPPPFFRYDNVPVQVRYSQQTYQPFRVQRIVDVGDDAQYGERKVLLDGVTPAWGEWTQTPAGERQFEVHKTQQFPGLDEPREGPLPGDYQLRLASDESSAGLSRRDAYLIATAIVLATLSLGAVAWSIMLGRRRPQH
jgi:hypothetical protein